MREFQAKEFAEGLRTGLRPYDNLPAGSQALVECYNAMPREAGLEEYTPIDAITFDSLALSWPYPQAFPGEYYTNVVIHGRDIHDYWHLNGNLIEAYTRPDYGDAPGHLMHFASFGQLMVLAAESWYDTYGGAYTAEVLYRHPGTLLWHSVTEVLEEGQRVPLGTTCCNFKGRLIIGDIRKIKDVPDVQIGWDWYDCTINYVTWSQPGAMESRPDVHPYSAGYMVMPWEGHVRVVKRLGDLVMVYGEQGIVALVSQLDPAPTFGLHEILGKGVLNRQCVAGDTTTHVFIDEQYDLWRIVAGEGPKKLGYREFMTNLTAANIVMHYDSQEKDVYITDGIYCYVLTPYGLCQVYQMPVALIQTSKWPSIDSTERLAGYFNESEDTYVRLASERTDFGIRGLKTLSTFETDTYTSGTLQGAVDYRHGRTAFTRSAWKAVNNSGVVSPIITAEEFRYCLRSDVLTGFTCGSIKGRVKLSDKRSIRGMYSAT